MDLGALGALNEIFGSQLDLDLLPQSEESHFWLKIFFFKFVFELRSPEGFTFGAKKVQVCAENF